MISSISQAVEKKRVGVYDSRCIAIWYYNSNEFNTKIKDLMDSLHKLKESKDTVHAKKLEEKGQLMQRIAHDKGFGRGSVAEILENKKDEIKSIASQENLLLIVSKWEVNYSDPEVEIVDVTLKLLDMLKAPESMKKQYEQMKSVKPIEDAFFIED
jgi:hypothetical protein